MPRRKLNIKESSHIQAAYHDPHTKVLTVEFADRSHEYFPVESATATNLEYAPSAGKYLHHAIIPHHMSRKVPK